MLKVFQMAHSLYPTDVYPQISIVCFSVTADSNPATLPRILEVFAKLGRIPNQCHSSVMGSMVEYMHIDLEFSNMDQTEAEHQARALRGCFLVTAVLTSQKQTQFI
jgi:hypothetical protein